MLVSPSEPPLTFGSLFAGIGGFDLGFERAGLVSRWQVENDPYCIKVLTKHWPEVPKYGDVRELSGSTLETVDIICGGFPCQPVSLAGRRQAQADERWLWPEFARLVDEIRPRYVVVENVPGLRTAGGAEVVADLASLGYDCEWDRVFAATFGAPHLRERFILVAHSGGERRQQNPRGTYGDEEANVGRGAEEDHQSSGDGESRGAGQVPRDVAHPNQLRRHGWSRFFGEGRGRQSTHGGGWLPEPDVGRVAHGVPSRMDRLRGLGNALMPQVAEAVAYRIIEHARLPF